MIAKSIICKIKSKKHLAWNVSYYFLASVIGAVVQLLMSPFLALKMEHYDYAIVGYFSSFNALVSPLMLFSLGAYYSRNFFRVDLETREVMRNTVTILSISLSFILSVVSLGGLYVYFRIANVSFPFAPYAFITISGLFFNSVYTIMVVDLKMNRKAKKYLFVHVSHAICSAIFALLLVIIFGLGGFGRMFATMLTSLVFFIYSASSLITRFQINWMHVREAIKFCWPLAAAAMLGYFTSGMDRAMLERLQNVTDLGLYSIATRIAGYLSMFSLALGQTFQPDIYKAIAEKNIYKTFIVIVTISVLGLVPIGLFMIFANPLISVLTFGRFTAAAGYAQILSLKNFTMSLYHSLCGVLEGYGYTKTVLFTRLFGSIAVFFLLSYMIDRFGFSGAAWGQVLSFIMMAVITLTYLVLFHNNQLLRHSRVLIKRLKK